MRLGINNQEEGLKSGCTKSCVINAVKSWLPTHIEKQNMDDRGYFRGEFQRPSPYQSPDSISPFRSTFVSQRSIDSPIVNGYNSSRTSYQDYPTTRRLLEDQHEYEKSKADIAEAAQETSSRDVITALKRLQEKFAKLELDRIKAEENLKHLTSETDEYKTILQRDRELSESAQSAIEIQKQELEQKLMTAEDKCQLLEKQIKYMRSIPQRPELDSTTRPYTYEPQPYRSSIQQPQGYMSPRNEKLAELERGQIKLTASQTLAESKIRELEEKLQEERHQRKLLQDRAAELQTIASTNRILLNMTSPEEQKPRRKIKKKKTVVKKKPPPAATPPAHYRLDMGNIPFVVGQSTSKSHALGANIQKIFSMMKAHNPQLCEAATQAQKRYHVIREPSTTSSSDTEGITELITQLQDEFGHMGFEHSELVKQIQETSDIKFREDLERELERLVTRMETKGEQIAILKEHERKHLQHKRRKSDAPNRRIVASKGSEIEVVTTIKTKGDTPKTETRVSKAPRSEPRVPNRSNNLDVFKRVQKLQGTLRQGDLSWD